MCHSEKGEIIPKCIAESSKVNIVNKEIVFVSRHFVKGLNTTHSKYVQFYICNIYNRRRFTSDRIFGGLLTAGNTLEFFLSAASSCYIE